MGVRELKRPMRRRVGRLVVTITAAGVELRGYRRRRSKLVVTWQQIAALSDHARQPLLAVDETKSGAAELLALHADPAAAVERKPEKQSDNVGPIPKPPKRMPAKCKAENVEGAGK